MFTGIVQAVGRVLERTARRDGMRLRVHAGTLDLGDVVIGDSIAVAGCCLTVVECAPPHLAFDVSNETLRCTTAFATAAVNLEKAIARGHRGCRVVIELNSPELGPETREYFRDDADSV